MSEAPTITTKLYAVSEHKVLSMHDLLEYFSRHGSMRVSDLHIKVGSPPVYRIDGDLQKLKGPPVDQKTVEALARALVSETEWAGIAGQSLGGQFAHHRDDAVSPELLLRERRAGHRRPRPRKRPAQGGGDRLSQRRVAGHRPKAARPGAGDGHHGRGQIDDDRLAGQPHRRDASVPHLHARRPDRVQADEQSGDDLAAGRWGAMCPVSSAACATVCAKTRT